MSKKIVLFADGTGNAFSKQESNVWRIFEALDTSDKDQVACYIPGVGTQEFWPLALLDSITGFGVPSNVRKLYEFLCWNWEPNCEIYMFGFSRGAFTIRMLIKLIENEGILPKKINGDLVRHADMQSNVVCAWRSYCCKDPIRKENLWVALGLRWLWGKIRGAFTRLSSPKTPPYSAVLTAQMIEQSSQNVKIKFVGLFDTVEAFGVPFEDLRSLIHRLLIPIQFGGHRTIWKNVQCVRHALSLDDERTSFHPIRIDRADMGSWKEKVRSMIPETLSNVEIAHRQFNIGKYIDTEKYLSAIRDHLNAEENHDVAGPDQIREVWFAGAHSDVGGGYADDELARIPLVWMLEELEQTEIEAATRNKKLSKLHLRNGALDEFRRSSSPFGTRHDSRAGVSALYRYCPRAVAAASRRFTSSKEGEQNAIINDVVVHYSVVQRLMNGSDRYAPVQLPGSAEVLTPNGKKEKISTYIQREPNDECLRRATNTVGKRKLTYVLTWAPLGSLLVLPLGPAKRAVNSFESLLTSWGIIPSQEQAEKPAQIAQSFLASLPDSVIHAWREIFPRQLVETIATHAPFPFSEYFGALRDCPIAFLVLAILSWTLLKRGAALGEEIHDDAYRAWNHDHAA